MRARSSRSPGTARATTATFSIPSRTVVIGTPEINMLNETEMSWGVIPSARTRS